MPDYLRDAIAQIDAFFDELAKHTKAHLRYARDTQLELELAGYTRKSFLFNAGGWWS